MRHVYYCWCCEVISCRLTSGGSSCARCCASWPNTTASTVASRSTRTSRPRPCTTPTSFHRLLPTSQLASSCISRHRSMPTTDPLRSPTRCLVETDCDLHMPWVCIRFVSSSDHLACNIILRPNIYYAAQQFTGPGWYDSSCCDWCDWWVDIIVIVCSVHCVQKTVTWMKKALDPMLFLSLSYSHFMPSGLCFEPPCSLADPDCNFSRIEQRNNSETTPKKTFSVL